MCEMYVTKKNIRKFTILSAPYLRNNSGENFENCADWLKVNWSSGYYDTAYMYGTLSLRVRLALTQLFFLPLQKRVVTN